MEEDPGGQNFCLGDSLDQDGSDHVGEMLMTQICILMYVKPPTWLSVKSTIKKFMLLLFNNCPPLESIPE